MNKRLLVPLDGSALAEAALPAAVVLAQVLHASIVLVHIIERNAPPQIHGERHLTEEDEAAAYLFEVTQRAIPPSIPTERHVHTEATGDVAKAIASHSDELTTNLVVMCTHGSGGLHGQLYGSIAQQVVNQGCLPVLLIQPDELNPRSEFACRRMLVPLDGETHHEAGLVLVRELAGACGATLDLLRVVATARTLSGQNAATGALLPGTTRVLLELAVEEAKLYLQRHLDDMHSAGLKAVASVRRGEVIPAILEVTRSANVDLVVLTTHGKTGTDAFWSGSLGPRLSTKSPVALLLIPASQ